MPRILLLLAFALIGCPPAVTPPPDTDLCPAMCAHIGSIDEGGLGCVEGQPIYSSALAGEAGVPNMTCTQFCQHQQASGIFINPRCVMQVTSCSQSEAVRQQTCK